MANAIVAFQNRTDAATLGGSGSWLTTLPLVNLQSRTIGKVARSTNALLASTQFTVDIGVNRPVRVISLVGHNFSLAAKVRMRGYSDAGFSTLVIDSGWLDVWPAVYNSYYLDWQADNWWTGKYLSDETAGYTWNYTYTMSVNTYARYWKIEIDDTTNSAGYIQIGRLFMGEGWQTKVNMVYGAGLVWETSTDVQTALSGAEYFGKRTPYRVATFTTDWMDVDEAMGKAFEIQRRMGVSDEIYFIYDPADTLHALRRQYLGRLRKLSPIENKFPLIYGSAWEIKELI